MAATGEVHVNGRYLSNLRILSHRSARRVGDKKIYLLTDAGSEYGCSVVTVRRISS